VVRRVNAADLRGFNKVVTALEQEAHHRVDSKAAQSNRKRKKASL
jgi:hypothetical protein